MATFRREPNGFIYLYHWVDPSTPLKVSTRIKIDEKGWNKKKARPRDLDANYRGNSIIREMERYESALIRALNKHDTDNIQLLREEVYMLLNKADTSNPVDFVDYFQAYVNEAKEAGKSNWKAYNTCLNHLNVYFSNKPVPYSSIDLRFYGKYNKYLTSKQLVTNTIATQWKLIKAVIGNAHREGLHTNDSYRHFKKKMESADTIFLSEEELNKMYKLKLIGYLEKARDYFLIGAYTGLRFDDWDRVSSEKVVNGVLKVRSTKTGEISTIPIHPVVSAILDKYEGELPHKPSNQKMNEYIKVVAMRANIKDHVETRITKGGVREINTSEKHELVTTHTARRSLATNLVLRGVSPYVVMKVTGHKSLSSFERYVRLQELEAMIELKSLSFFL
jgi:site-specific recombinase XerD